MKNARKFLNTCLKMFKHAVNLFTRSPFPFHACLNLIISALVLKLGEKLFWFFPKIIFFKNFKIKKKIANFVYIWSFRLITLIMTTTIVETSVDN